MILKLIVIPFYHSLQVMVGKSNIISKNKTKLKNIKRSKLSPFMVYTIEVSYIFLFTIGKSFLASKLSNRKLPKGFSTSTVGLSVIYPEAT